MLSNSFKVIPPDYEFRSLWLQIFCVPTASSWEPETSLLCSAAVYRCQFLKKVLSSGLGNLGPLPRGGSAFGCVYKGLGSIHLSIVFSASIPSTSSNNAWFFGRGWGDPLSPILHPYQWVDSRVAPRVEWKSRLQCILSFWPQFRDSHIFYAGPIRVELKIFEGTISKDFECERRWGWCRGNYIVMKAELENGKIWILMFMAHDSWSSHAWSCPTFELFSFYMYKQIFFLLA